MTLLQVSQLVQSYMGPQYKCVIQTHFLKFSTMHVAYVMRKVVLVMFVGARLLAITGNDENLNSKFLAHFREKHCYTNRNNFTKDSGKIMYTCHGAR